MIKRSLTNPFGDVVSSEACELVMHTLGSDSDIYSPPELDMNLYYQITHARASPVTRLPV